MFYIYADGELLYSPLDESRIVTSPRLTLEMGKVGSLTFSLPPSNRLYAKLRKLQTVITVEYGESEIFRGRVLSEEKNFNNIKTVYCEGNLAYLVDSVQKGEAYTGTTRELFTKILNAHNARVEAAKRFLMGDVTIENRSIIISGQSDDILDVETDKFDYKQIAINSITNEWKTTYDYLSTCLIDYCGGYLRTRRVGNDTYLDYVTDYGNAATQEVEFGVNILDLKEEISAEDLFTVLIPLGDENLTIASVNGGSDELVDVEAVETYGKILRTHVFSNVNSPATLMENGQRYLASNVNIPITITVTAVDLHLMNPDIKEIYIGDVVHVKSAPHGIVRDLTCSKIEYDLENPANTQYTFGVPKQTLTERYKKDRSRESGAGGGGDAGGGGGVAGAAAAGAGRAAGAASEEAKSELDRFFDAWINVDPESAHIDLGALYKEMKDGKDKLKSEVGIDLDAVTGNINIKSFREEFDDLGTRVTAQGAHIDLVQADAEAQINLAVSRVTTLEGVESGHYASIVMRANDLESAIELKADRVDVQALNIKLSALVTSVEGLEDEIDEARVDISAVSRIVDANNLEIANNKASITALANSTQSSISSIVSRTSNLETRSASLELVATELESSITAKADKVTLNSRVATINSEITTINGNITNINSEITNVKTLIANEIKALKIDTSWLNAKMANLDVGVYAPFIRASMGMSVAGKNVATEEYVQTKVSDMATKSWVDSQGYLTSLPSSITASTIKATSSMQVGVEIVATRYWCITTQGYATQAWVLQQLANYAYAGHSHYGYLTSLPAHSHSFSGSGSISIGHTHYTRVGGTSYESGGMTNQAGMKSIYISGYTGTT